MTANYSMYFIEEHNVIVLEDLNLGNRSLTNDIENVLLEVRKKHPDLDKHKIIYKDSMNIYDGIKLKDGKFLCFYPIQEKDIHEAIKKAI